jgi:glycerol-3-phosphate acyltransferase PlsY
MLALILLTLSAYLLGSIPTGYWAGKLFARVDVRTSGSCSTGATNVLRTAGKVPALITLIVDIGKGYLPVWLAIYLEQAYPNLLPVDNFLLIPPAMALLSVIGHSKSIFLGFAGGKSAATGLGTLLALQWQAGLALFALWLLVLAISRIVSLASIITGGLTPVLMYLFGAPASYAAYGLAAGVYVIVRHKSNIVRLLAGQEPRVGQKVGEKVDIGKSQ